MRWFSVVILCLLGGMAIPSAQAGEKIHSSLDLTNDKKVAELEPQFIFVSRSNVVYAHCTRYWLITPEQAAFQKVAFQRVSDNYMQAFYDAYLKRVGSPPSSAVTNNYTKYVYAKQDKAQKEISELIARRTNGCENGRVVRVLKFIERMRYDDIAEKEKLGQVPPGTVKALVDSASKHSSSNPVAPAVPATHSTPTTSTPGSL